MYLQFLMHYRDFLVKILLFFRHFDFCRSSLLAFQKVLTFEGRNCCLHKVSLHIKKQSEKKRNKAMADFLTETQIGEIQNAYNAIDTDADGIIATSDLGSLLRLLGQNPTDAELQVRNLIH